MLGGPVGDRIGRKRVIWISILGVAPFTLLLPHVDLFWTSVLSIVIVILGMVALMDLPVAQYPEILPPQVSVTASYPGASAQVIAETVAAPLEQQINGVEGMIYQLSNSASSASSMAGSSAGAS